MAPPLWSLTLLLSDGRSPCSRSKARGGDLRLVLLALLATMHPPQPPVSRPVWLRLDALPPDHSPGRRRELIDQVHEILLPSLAIDRPAQELQSADGRLLHLWLDLSRPRGATTQPLLEAQARALAWWQRQMEGHGHDDDPAIQLAALQLLHPSTERPDLELTAYRLTRAVLQASDTSARGSVHQRRHRHLLQLAVLAHQPSQQAARHPQLLARCQQLQRGLLESLGGLTPAQQATALFSLALAQARGIGDAKVNHALQDLCAVLQRIKGAAAARSSCLFSLLVLAEGECLSWSPAPDQLQAIAALKDPEQIREPGSALRAVLMLRLAEVLHGSRPSAWQEVATAVLLRHQCGASQAIEADDPQQVLGGFGGSRRGPAPMAQQLIPLLALDQLRQLNDSHAPV